MKTMVQKIFSKFIAEIKKIFQIVRSFFFRDIVNFHHIDFSLCGSYVSEFRVRLVPVQGLSGCRFLLSFQAHEACVTCLRAYDEFFQNLLAKTCQHRNTTRSLRRFLASRTTLPKAAQFADLVRGIHANQ